MKAIKRLRVSVAGGGSFRGESPRARVRSAPACEALEGRQLLNAGWGTPGAPPTPGAGMPPAEFHRPGGAHGFTPPATLSAAAKAEWQALQADEKTLMGEIKADTALASLTARVKADETLIRTTLGAALPAGAGRESYGFIKAGDGSIAPNPHGHPGPGHGYGHAGKGPGPGLGRGGFGGFDGPGGPASLPAALVTRLEAKGITADQIAGINNDLKAVQTEIAGVDAALQARIKTERQALAKDMPAPPMHFDHIMNRAKPSGTTTTTTTTTA